MVIEVTLPCLLVGPFTVEEVSVNAGRLPERNRCVPWGLEKVQHNPARLRKRSIVWIGLTQCVSPCVNQDVKHVAVGAVC